MKDLKEFKFVFQAIKAMFTNKKVRKLVGRKLFIALAIGLLGSMVMEGAIYSLAAKVAQAYTGNPSF